MHGCEGAGRFSYQRELDAAAGAVSDEALFGKSAIICIARPS
jgi:hypothetical protein